MLETIKQYYGDKKSERQLKIYKKNVDTINEWEHKIETLTDEELQHKTVEFKERIAEGATVDTIKEEAFAVVREAAKRKLGMRHYDVQLIGGLVLLEGNIAEMMTGEGKTLVASLPSYLRALEGKGVHVITVNEYLAQRDRELIGPIHEFLGLTVGLNITQMSPEEKKQAYQADITYGIGTEFGFDYLRDNMAQQPAQRVQRPYHYAIVDEIDSVLVDEAKTPLIIAGKTMASPQLHRVCAKLAKSFKAERDYNFDVTTKATSLTEDGITKVERAFGVDNLFELEHQTLYHYMIQGVRAHVMFERDVDYIVDEGQVKLIDMFTGRMMEGRTLSDGLHQAIEAKEGLEITEENKTQANITIQNYFRMYPILSGMTGTAKTEEKEFQHTYNMDVIQIPTNKPIIRQDLEDYIYATKEQKYKAMLDDVKERHSNGQPILIGTTSILQSETVANYLDEENIPYELLNAKSVEQEVRLISLAGQKGQVTIATNMAGRGTDIMLGEGAAEAGGLHVLGTERHESRRIDNQLKGRSGRQGDPGSTQFIISMEDDMMHRFAQEETERKMKSLKTDDTGLVLNKDIYKFIDTVQRISEGSNFNIREFNLKLDDVINDQRGVIYTLRNQFLESKSSLELVLPYITDYLLDVVEKECPETIVPEKWNLGHLETEINRAAPLIETNLTEQSFESIDDVKDYVQKIADEYTTKIEVLSKNIMLQNRLKQVSIAVIDRQWIRHLEMMNRLREGIGMRQYQQEDPLRLYQNEGLDVFHHTMFEVKREMVLQLSRFVQGIRNKKQTKS
ncbi:MULTISPECIES: accessory Sec system translocase SecA2 [Pontibacillus]|uniref:Protein translocase subunit SecA n=1 Tax=Pontibacillus chungwhensis TaxID=265426 RepID=A0ABY8UVE2_9BACI|nr:MULTISPECIES: accessory Sec system translocase SecA2 [Pontibacillus]MCD5325927.1 accessory Sec system translocase SecA2 [Pontibacillus sp. HN14]WIF97637.1 accessory Sec system translocase SecA2 [Pontibacillus chungwhensis]